MYVQIFQPRG